MGTRGMFGVVIDGQVKASYNHFDSYPDGLGNDMVNQVQLMLKEWGKEVMIARSRALEMVSNEDHRPTEEQKKVLAMFASDVTYGDGTGHDDWYNLLRELQGNLMDTLTVGLMIEGGANFAMDSLFCEWGYLVNLDDGTLEVYRGFQKEPHTRGRFVLPEGEEPEAPYEGASQYYPIALINEFPLDDIPNQFAQIVEFCALDLFITEDGHDWRDGNEAVGSLKDGESVIGYSVYSGETDPITRVTREAEGVFKITNIEDEDEAA